MSHPPDTIEHMFDVEGTVPPELDEMEPGIQLALYLQAIDVTGRSGHDRITVLRAHQRMADHYAAEVYRDMNAVSDWLHQTEDDPQLATESAAAEIRVALRFTRRTADVELDLAINLRRRLPQVWKLLSAGDIDVRRARTMIQGTSHLPVATAREVIEQVTEAAPRLTTGQPPAYDASASTPTPRTPPPATSRPLRPVEW